MLLSNSIQDVIMGINFKIAVTGFSYFCTLPIIIIYFKIISVQQFEVQQLKYWKSQCPVCSHNYVQHK
jgi:hypothetical protein